MKVRDFLNHVIYSSKCPICKRPLFLVAETAGWQAGIIVTCDFCDAIYITFSIEEILEADAAFIESKIIPPKPVAVNCITVVDRTGNQRPKCKAVRKKLCSTGGKEMWHRCSLTRNVKCPHLTA